ncbi:hypothetical protein DERF_010320 [Dermatophagoides farinae]|uniref:Uncharacterized protein n=1 Tax=Dermatophagoides farinae TaxID=6954 RepID=A0A922L3E9_DERFA|nr:hypothetical protein DERF_010320 [Dermatophagoides farinae]
MPALIPYIAHQNIYPIPYRSLSSPSSSTSIQPSAIPVYSSPLITTIRWSSQRYPIAFTAAMPIFAHYITTTTAANNHRYGINQNMFQKRIDTLSTKDNNNNKDNDNDNNAQSVRCKITSEASSAINRPLASSETYPVYVLPPKDFQPIIYQQPSSLASFFTPLPLIYQQQQPNKFDQIPEEVWYDFSLNNEKDLKLNTMKSNQIDRIEQFDKNKITLIPVDGADFDNLPLMEASATTSVKQVNNANDTNIVVAKNNINIDKIDKSSYPTVDEAINPYSSRSDDGDDDDDVAENTATSINRGKSRKTTSSTLLTNKNSFNHHQNNQRWQYKTKLPVGLSSFILGGTRGVSGRHWHLPTNIQKQLEFMPNLNPPIMTNEYYPDPTTMTTDLIVDKNGQPEKEDDDYNNNDNGDDNKRIKTKTTTTLYSKNLFNMNTVVDRDEDLDAQESIMDGDKIIIETLPKMILAR